MLRDLQTEADWLWGADVDSETFFARNITVTNKKQSCERHCVMGDFGENMAEKEQLYI